MEEEPGMSGDVLESLRQSAREWLKIRPAHSEWLRQYLEAKDTCTLRLNSTPECFAAWLRQHLEGRTIENDVVFPTERGKLFLMNSLGVLFGVGIVVDQYKDDAGESIIKLRLEGSHWITSEEGISGDLQTVISFHLTPLARAPNRLEVVGRCCCEPAALRLWFCDVLREISETYSVENNAARTYVKGVLDMLGAEKLEAVVSQWPAGASIVASLKQFALDETRQDVADASPERHRGAPRLEERMDSDDKKKTAEEYLALRRKGVSAETAAQRLGHARRTLDEWVKRFGVKK